MRQRGVGRTGGRETAFKEGDARHVLARERARARRREDARTVGRPRRAPAAERQVRVKVARVEVDALRADPRGQLAMKRPEFIDAGADTGPKDARRAARGKYAGTAEDDVKGSGVDIPRERLHDRRHARGIDVSEKDQRQVRAVGPDPFQRAG